MRNLQTKDLFTIARIIKESNIKESIKNLGFNETTTDEQMMISIVFEAVVNAPDAEGEIFKFLADIAGVKVKEIQEDEFDIILEIIEHLKGQEKFLDFLKRAFKFAN